MKIITEGVLPESFVYRTTCRRCRTEFEFTRAEAQFHDDQRDGAFVSIDCPKCHDHCYVQERLGRPPSITT